MIEHGKGRFSILRTEPEHHDAGMCAGRVGALIGKIQIEGDEHPTLAGRGAENNLVRSADEFLGYDRLHIMPVPREKWCGGEREVLVELEVQGRAGASG